jgi:hypothetical protein
MLSLAVAALAWTVLFLSGSGLLIGSERSRLPGDGQDSLVCQYFVATSILEQAYWYAPNGFMGKAVCPVSFVFEGQSGLGLEARTSPQCRPQKADITTYKGDI